MAPLLNGFLWNSRISKVLSILLQLKNLFSTHNKEVNLIFLIENSLIVYFPFSKFLAHARHAPISALYMYIYYTLMKRQ